MYIYIYIAVQESIIIICKYTKHNNIIIYAWVFAYGGARRRVNARAFRFSSREGTGCVPGPEVSVRVPLSPVCIVSLPCSAPRALVCFFIVVAAAAACAYNTISLNIINNNSYFYYVRLTPTSHAISANIIYCHDNNIKSLSSSSLVSVYTIIIVVIRTSSPSSLSRVSSFRWFVRAASRPRDSSRHASSFPVCRLHCTVETSVIIAQPQRNNKLIYYFARHRQS